MTERSAGYDPTHPNSNIHGMINSDGSPTCLTSEGTMCTGCCYALQITHNSQPDGIILKEAGEMCEAQVANKGCRHLMTNQPSRRYPVCPIYHCSGDLAKAKNRRLPLSVRQAAYQRVNWENVAALNQEEIGPKTFHFNVSNHIGEPPEV